ncbi:MAG: DUF308 domain-containing protein [Candidatus Saccharimonadales bacterium]
MPKKSNSQKRDDQQEILNKILHAKWSVILRGVLGIILGYAFLSRAFDTGSWIQYFTAVLFAILGIKILWRYFKEDYGKKVNQRKAR